MAKYTPQQAAGKSLSYLEKAIYVFIGLLLVIMAIFTIVGSIHDIITIDPSKTITTQLTSVLNDILFTIILMELLGTVATHLFKGGFQLKSFLIIGIISSVRRILVIGAQLSASQHESAAIFNREIKELAIDAAVILALAISLMLMRRRTKVAESGATPLDLEE